jgi:putative DNA methylase
MHTRKKLIEVALPLEAINTASEREKSMRHGHPSTLHLWWARRPLASARAVIFSQIVDDPSEYVDELLVNPQTRLAAERAFKARLKAWEERRVVFDKASAAGMSGAANPDPGLVPTLEGTAADIERQRLFELIEKLVLWENTTNEAVLQPARDEIWKSWQRTCRDNADHPRAAELFDPQKLPAFHDPFAGGGALPLEAQRLGLEAYASDLNPVAVLINKAMIEIPPKFAGMPPVNPEARKSRDFWSRQWKGAEGLAEDVRYYGRWMRDEAEKRIGHLYPKIEITAEMAVERPDLKSYIGQKLTVIAWLWARTVKSPNPAFSKIEVPLITTFMLSTKVGKEAYIEPVIENGSYRFNVKIGKPKDPLSAKHGTKLGSSGSSFFCLMSGTPMPFEYLREEAKAHRMGIKLMAIVADSERGRIYFSPTTKIEAIALSAQPQNVTDTELPVKALGFRVQEYGMTRWRDLFTNRQLVALTTYSDLVQEVRELVKEDAFNGNLPDDKKQHLTGDITTTNYFNSICIYLGLLVDQQSNQSSTICGWNNINQQMIVTFSRQAIPMVWDFAECNVFSTSTGSFWNLLERQVKGIATLGSKDSVGKAFQQDAAVQEDTQGKIVATDPPYYDNIGYADLSDYFYFWLRRSLKSIIPDLFVTLTTPKVGELIASPFRHGNREKAEKFFLDGMTKAMSRLVEQSNSVFPVTIYYAFKQTESDINGTASTGWDTFLDAVINSGFKITGTWPIKTESANKLKAEVSALASSIVLVCRKRLSDAQTTTRRELILALQNELPDALSQLQLSNIAPVDLAQAAIGPGMAVYTRYSKVLDAQGQPVTVRQALALINQVLDEVLAEQEGDFDADTRWALAWFEQNGFSEGEYGTAETLSKAKDTSVEGMVQAGILKAGKGKVRLLLPAELPADWDPDSDQRLTTWEMVHQLIRALEGWGEAAAAALLARLGARAEAARELCYRLFTLCERKKRTTSALSYNALVQSWPEITRLAREQARRSGTQAALF